MKVNSDKERRDSETLFMTMYISEPDLLLRSRLKKVHDIKSELKIVNVRTDINSNWRQISVALSAKWS